MIIFFSIFLGIFRYATIGLWKRSTILWMGELDSGRNYPKFGLLSKLQRIWHGLENPCFGRGPGTQFCTRQTLPKSCFYGVSSDYLSTCIFHLLGFFLAVNVSRYFSIRRNSSWVRILAQKERKMYFKNCEKKQNILKIFFWDLRFEIWDSIFEIYDLRFEIWES